MQGGKIVDFLRIKKKKYLTDKIDALETNRKIKIIGDR